MPVSLGSLSPSVDPSSPSTLASSHATAGSPDQHVHAQSPSHANSRGRTNRKRSHSVEETICVVALLVKEQHGPGDKARLEMIQDVRRRFDQAYSRWEPHLTLIPPFTVPFYENQEGSRHSTQAEGGSQGRSLLHEALEGISETIQQVCSRQAQHTLTLDSAGHFSVKRYSTVHLRPSTSTDHQAFLELQSGLHMALGQAQENARNKGRQKTDGFKPHLTLGQAFNSNAKQELYRLASLAASPEAPFEVGVDRIQLMVKPANRSGPYDVYRHFNLGQ